MQKKANLKRISQFVVFTSIFFLVLQTSFTFSNLQANLNENQNTDEIIEAPILLESATSTATEPLFNEFTPLAKLPEIMVYGTDTDGGDLNGYVYDDSYNNFNLIKTWDENDNSDNPAVAWGDFDADGKDEFILASTDNDDADLNLWIRDDANAAYNGLVESDANDNLCEPEVTAADFDGDGMDEIAQVASVSDLVKIRIWEMQDIGGINAFLVPTYIDAGAGTDPDVCYGDIDGDDLDEIICMARNGDHLVGWVYDYTGSDYSQIKSWDLAINIQNPHVATGDVDGDRIDEIMFLGEEDDGGDLEGRLFDDALHQFALIHTWDRNDNSANPDVVCGDFDGDFLDEIAFYLTDSDNGDMNLWIWDDYEHLCVEMYHRDYNDNLGLGSIAAGDLYLEGRDELVVAAEKGSAVQVLIFDYYQNAFRIRHSFETGECEDPCIALGDTHGDGIQIQYLNQSPVIYNTPPQIMTIVAAAPTISGISQNYDFTETVVGSEEFTSETSSQTTAVMSSVKVSFEFEFFDEALGFSVASTVSQESSKTNSYTTEYGKATYYHLGSSEDAIIYSITEYAQYSYTMSSHPDSSMIGQSITIACPISYEVYKTQLDTFNTQYPSFNVDDVFEHTIGDAGSYLEKDELIDQIDGTYWASDQVNVGQGTGVSSVSIDLSQIETSASERTEEVVTSESAHLFFLHVELSQGTSQTSCYEVSVGSGFHYEASVGDIENAEQWEELMYGYGLVVYSYTHPTQNYTCKVVNFWVEGDPNSFFNRFKDTLESWIPIDWYYTAGGAGIILFGSIAAIAIKLKKKK